MFNTKLLFAVLLLLLGLTACSGQTARPGPEPSPSEGPPPFTAAYRPDLMPERTEIPFGPGFYTSLNAASPPSDWKLLKTFDLPAGNGLPASSVHLYAETEKPSTFYGYLESGGQTYELGSIHAENPESAGIRVIGLGDGRTSAIQYGKPSSEDDLSSQVSIATYEPDTQNWICTDFQGHSSGPLDLDLDGEVEWVGNHTYDVPPYVEIHRWSPAEHRFRSYAIQWISDLFPSADDTVASYSYLFEDNGRRIIEIGRSGDYAFFTYDKGALVKAELQDTHSRVQKLQESRRHSH